MQSSRVLKVYAYAAAACFLVFADGVKADGRRPVFVRQGAFAVPANPSYRRYDFGPATGRFGTLSYAVTNRRIAAYSPFGYAPWRYGSSIRYGYVPFAPIDGVGILPSYGPAAWGFYDFNPYANPVLQATLLENELRWGTRIPSATSRVRPRARPRPATLQQQAKSIHAQAEGDAWMRRRQFLNAYERYRVAINAANDRPEPYFRMAFALAAIGSFDSAVKYLKQGLEIDPQWPAHGDRLDAVFGEDNRLAVLSMIEHVSGWVREDIRDPDRLFLIGVILHFDGDSRADEFFEAAYRLAGTGDHLLAFLQPQSGPAPNSVAAPRQPNARVRSQPFTGFGNSVVPPPAPMEPPVRLGNPQVPGGSQPPLVQPNPSGRRPVPLGPIPPPMFQDSGHAAPVPGPGTVAPGNSAAPSIKPNAVAPSAQPNRAPVAPKPVAPKTETAPKSPALPLPPLPIPADSDPSVQSSPNLNGPALLEPAGDAGTDGPPSP